MSVKEYSWRTFEEHTCRVCLELANGNSLSIFDNFRDQFIYTYIQMLSDIKIYERDAFPKSICKRCFLELETAVNFKEKCQTSNKILLSNKVDIKVEDILKTETCSLKLEDADDDYPSDHEDTKLNSYSTFMSMPKSEGNNLAPFQCHDCGDCFVTKTKLRVHWKRLHYAQNCIKICPRCKQTFKSRNAYDNHLRNMNKRCEALGDKLIRIEGAGKNRIFHCRECSYNTTLLQNILNHCARHSGNRPHQCNLCSKAFIQYSSLSKHKEYTHKQYKHIITCQFCGKVYKGAESINRHLKTHTEDKKFQCDLCKKMYKTKVTLQYHIQSHQARTLTCEKCAKVFHTASGLWIHIQYVHNKHTRKLHKCSICEYKNLKLYNIKKHEQKHTNSNIACPVCGKFFEKIEKMLKHQQMHYMEKKFACNYCDRKYLYLDSLHKHQKTAHAVQFL